jgi:hypothetical protein
VVMTIVKSTRSRHFIHLIVGAPLKNSRLVI